MGTTMGLHDDAVDEPQRLEPLCRDAEGLGGIGGLARTLPENGGTALLARSPSRWPNCSIRTWSATAMAQGSAGAALTNHRGNEGHLEACHDEQVSANGL